MSERRVRVKVMAEELSVSERLIRQWLARGMPHARVNGLILLDPTQVQAWIDSHACIRKEPGVKRTLGSGKWKEDKRTPLTAGWQCGSIPEFY